MKKQATGSQVFLDGESFYKIENFDCMTDFFMTVTSSSDVWNFCWAQGGISAGRRNSEFAIFPYYTCDKLSDTKGTTGAVTIIRVKNDGKKGIVWQPFENLSYTGVSRYEEKMEIQRNLYKNQNGSKIWFEEVNLALGLSFRYGWTSSSKYGLVKMSHIENLTDKKISIEILDGARNIMSAHSPSEIQNTKSVLLDAYKKSEVTKESNIALFSLSSVLTDRAEPSEALSANVCWFSTHDKVILSDMAIPYFIDGKSAILLDNAFEGINELHGKRGECYIIHSAELLGKSAERWEQVLDTDYDSTKLVQLESEILQRSEAVKKLLDDISKTEEKLTLNIAAADGLQETKNGIGDLHHRTNVMFNIMRGGIFANDGKISVADFLRFAGQRNKALKNALADTLKNEEGKMILRSELKNILAAQKSPQLMRLFREYLPLTFSRRHGDPSRPWNKFSIDLLDENGNDAISYEGNWRDIFQNWEALLWSYPEYCESVISVFLDAMTIEGFNPYRISRNGIDWEVPEEGNPWAQYGYWGDHQVIYLQKLLEFMAKYDKKGLISLLSEKSFSSANLPYRLKSYSEICKTPRSSIVFDHELDIQLKKDAKTFGTDAFLVHENGEVQLTTMTTKLVQLILAKMLNHIPEAGIWMNTQRPEWNDANNALAGYGTSVVTMCYLQRMLKFLLDLLKESPEDSFPIAKTVLETLQKTADLYAELNQKTSLTDTERKEFCDKAGFVFQSERNSLYREGFAGKCVQISKKELIKDLESFEESVRRSIQANKREDGLYHSYNSVLFTDSELSIMHLKLMLEGQVAALSCSVPSKTEKVQLVTALRNSPLFEKSQHSYMLYPNTELKHFTEKNTLTEAEVEPLKGVIAKTGSKILKMDLHGNYHFNAQFRNAETIREFVANLDKEIRPNELELALIEALYEKTFNHQSFTGRSGTFYAYEGLGCIYWHMVSKLLLAVQENITNNKDSLFSAYKDVKRGLGSAKTPEVYGAFPFDPYSHTPYLQGARQPGMTGQVKEEILARFGELGLDMNDGKAVFNPHFLEKSEFTDGKVKFSWCGTPIEYQAQSIGICVTYTDGKERTFAGNELPKEESELLFSRSKKIKVITVGIKKEEN
ncbi:hypothetical protein [Treponema zioleckii]|uniref:hypothetical protein n=1 Tax=Treponema zioleckii TaxID=331680 RepID=UPI00168B1D36|nr:hypothetical protein [Treponema zioleckii]